MLRLDCYYCPEAAMHVLLASIRRQGVVKRLSQLVCLLTACHLCMLREPALIY